MSTTTCDHDAVAFGTETSARCARRPGDQTGRDDREPDEQSGDGYREEPAEHRARGRDHDLDDTQPARGRAR